MSTYFHFDPLHNHQLQASREQHKAEQRARRCRRLESGVLPVARTGPGALGASLNERVGAFGRDELVAKDARDPKHNPVRPTKASLDGVLSTTPSVIDIADREFLVHLRSEKAKGRRLSTENREVGGN